VREPDPELLLPAGAAGSLAIPAGLIDQCGQIAVFGLVRDHWTRDEVVLAFPTRLARVEFVAERPAQMRAVARMRGVDSKLLSDVEFVGPDGTVAARVLGREEDITRLPADLYAYWSSPRRVHLSRDITEVFRGVPGIDHCTICATANVGDALLMNRLWAQVLARMILSRAELNTYAGLKLPPLALASWLLGRAAVKDAVRLHERLDVCMADVEVVTEETGRPAARVADGKAPLVSLTHKGFAAAAVAAEAMLFRGVGIDMEPLTGMDAGVRADCFTAAESAVIRSAARSTGEREDWWYLSAWAAKEAVGKALGRGIVGGPRAVEVLAMDASTGRLSLGLRGAMADAFPEYATVKIEAHLRRRDAHVLALCLLPSQ
jgi:phosphopantetheinyl transferase (holo-ACP synthase)